MRQQTEKACHEKLKSSDDGAGGGGEGTAGSADSGNTLLKSAASLTSDALMGRTGVGGDPVRSADAVLRDVRRRTARERVRMLDLFKDFDRLGHGESTGKGHGGTCAAWVSDRIRLQ